MTSAPHHLDAITHPLVNNISFLLLLHLSHPSTFSIHMH